MIKIDDTTTSKLVDSGTQSTVLGERQPNNLVRKGLKTKLQPEELEELNGIAVFFELDVNIGFRQIALEQGNHNLSAGDSLHCYKRLSFGINSALKKKTKKIIKQTISGCRGATNIANDILEQGKTTADHDRNLVTLLNRL